ncbi:unnamed protein product [Rotaria sp. Silwood2]|nr:unnamed protein product [Rotaria sp. Silwood2]
MGDCYTVVKIRQSTRILKLKLIVQTSTYNNQVQKWIQGANRSEIMINTDRPFSTAIDNEESIYISFISSSKLKKYRKRVTNGRVFLSGEVVPFPLTVDRHRSIYMVDRYHDRVFQIDEGRTNISIVIGGSEHIGTHQLSKPHSVAVDRGPGPHSDQLHGPTD